MKKKFFITTTIPASLNFFKGHLDFLNQHYNVTAISSNRNILEDIGRREGIKTYCIPMVRPISIFRDLTCLVRFIILFLRQRPYIVHGNTPKASFLSMVSAWLTRVPIRIYMCHGLRYQGETNPYKRKLLIAMEKIACQCATKVICVSHGVQKTLISDNVCASQKTMVVHHGSPSGINTSYFDRNNQEIKNTINQELGIKATDFTFIFIGRIVKDKGVNELVNAFCKLQETHTNAHLILVGPTHAETNQIAESTESKINTTNAIHLVGGQKDIRPFLMNANAIVLPSYREGLGMVLIEAGAMSVPGSASNIIGCNEIIIPGQNGELVEAKNEEALYTTMKKWIENPEYVNTLSKQARNLVIERYSQTIVWEHLLNAYHEISTSK